MSRLWTPKLWTPRVMERRTRTVDELKRMLDFRAKAAYAMPRKGGMENMLDWTAGGTVSGSFRVCVPFNMPNAQVANCELVALQWTNQVQDMVLEEAAIIVSQSNVAASAESIGDVRLFFAAGFTAADTGGTAIAPQRKNRQSMNPSNVADFRYANGAAAGLTVGTRTLNPQPFLGVTYHLVTVANLFAQYGPVTWDNRGGAIYPMVISSNQGTDNQGLILRSTAAHPATGACTVYLTLDWTEVSAGSMRT